MGLAELSDTGHFHDRGFFLPICETSGLFMIRVNSDKSLAVAIKHFYLPMAVLPPFVFSECCWSPTDFHLQEYYHVEATYPQRNQWRRFLLSILSCCGATTELSPDKSYRNVRQGPDWSVARWGVTYRSSVDQGQNGNAG